MRLPIARAATVARKLGSLMWSRKREFLGVLALQITVVVCGVMVPFVVGRGIDAVTRGTTRGHVGTLVALIAAAVVLQAAFSFAAERASIRFAEKVLHELRLRVVGAVTHMPLGIVENVGSGEMIGRTTNDVDRVQVFVQMALARIIYLTTTVTVTLVAIIAQAPSLGSLVVLSMLPVFVAIRWYISRSASAYLAVSALRAGLAGVVSETVEQNETADALRLGRSRVNRADVVIHELWGNELYTGWVRALYFLVQQVLVTSPVLVAILLGGRFISAGALTLGAVTAVALYAMQLREPLWDLGWWMDETQFAMVALARILGVEEVEPEVFEGSETPESGEVAIRDVRFAYDNGVEVLHGVTMSIREGETIAVVGPSGAGKSTLGRLIAGVNPPLAGSVQIGGAEVTRIAQGHLHSTVAMVTQEHHVFAGTLAENLNLAKADATEEEMIDALAAVGATWISDLEEGLGTKVGSGALALTPPQAQQLALARIVLLDPAVLVLDEATSLLDPTAARSLERTLARVLAGRTVISIAHRLYTAHDADRVAVVIDGRLVEFGAHDELVARGGEYAKLWAAWQQD